MCAETVRKLCGRVRRAESVSWGVVKWSVGTGRGRHDDIALFCPSYALGYTWPFVTLRSSPRRQKCDFVVAERITRATRPMAGAEWGAGSASTSVAIAGSWHCGMVATLLRGTRRGTHPHDDDDDTTKPPAVIGGVGRGAAGGVGGRQARLCLTTGVNTAFRGGHPRLSRDQRVSHRNRPRPGARLWGIGLATRLLFRNMKACRWRSRKN